MKLRKNKKGFTLVELVVVIAILAILASTATVATIAILNNARKTPVSSAAGDLKNQISYYVVDVGFTENLNETASNKAGFKQYLAQQLPDVVVDTGTNVAKPTDGKIHVVCSKTSGLKSSTWTATVINEYYKCVVTCTYDSTIGGMKFSVGSVEKA